MKSLITTEPTAVPQWIFNYCLELAKPENMHFTSRSLTFKVTEFNQSGQVQAFARIDNKYYRFIAPEDIKQGEIFDKCKALS